MGKVRDAYNLYKENEDKIKKPMVFNDFKFKNHEFEATNYEEVLNRLSEIERALDRLSNHCTVDIYVSKALVEAKNDLSKIEVFLRNKEA